MVERLFWLQNEKDFLRRRTKHIENSTNRFNLFKLSKLFYKSVPYKHNDMLYIP